MDMQDLHIGTLDGRQGTLHAVPVQVVNRSLLKAQNHVPSLCNTKYQKPTVLNCSLELKV